MFDLILNTSDMSHFIRLQVKLNTFVLQDFNFDIQLLVKFRYHLV